MCELYFPPFFLLQIWLLVYQITTTFNTKLATCICQLVSWTFYLDGKRTMQRSKGQTRTHFPLVITINIIKCYVPIISVLIKPRSSYRDMQWLTPHHSINQQIESILILRFASLCSSAPSRLEPISSPYKWESKSVVSTHHIQSTAGWTLVCADGLFLSLCSSAGAAILGPWVG